jgi:hypothetical protein
VQAVLKVDALEVDADSLAIEALTSIREADAVRE